MPRPDLTAERTEQILDAFETCILRHGLESSSLEKVAEEGGMKRQMIRHYIGNREDLIQALTDRFVARYRHQTRALIESLGGQDRLKALLDALFASGSRETAASVLIFENLIAAAGELEEVRQRLSGWTDEFVKLITTELRRAYPSSKGHREVAWGVVSIYYNHVSLLPLGLSRSLQRGSRAAAERLIASLRD